MGCPRRATRRQLIEGWGIAKMYANVILSIAVSFTSVPDVTWEKLADPPKDVAGRESPAGTDGAWVYVPDWKGFLLYGGSSPTYSNEGRSSIRTIKNGRSCGHTVRHGERADQPWRVLLRAIPFVADGPAPRGCTASSMIAQQASRLFGGHPPRTTRKLGPRSPPDARIVARQRQARNLTLTGDRQVSPSD